MTDQSQTENTLTPASRPVHPYAKTLEENLTTQRNMLTLLERKLEVLLQINSYEQKYDAAQLDSLQELAMIERSIMSIRTKGEIDTLKKVITEKENYYKQYMEQFEKDEADMNLHYKHTLSIAQKSTKPHVISLLQRVNIHAVESDLEAKISFYKQLKKHV